MRKRYSVFLTGQLAQVQNQVISFNFDLRTLIPESCRGKHLMVHSAFDSNLVGNALIGGLRISVNLPQTFNKSFQNSDITAQQTRPQFVVLGVANPISVTSGGNTVYKYQYAESECFVKMIEYPDVYPLNVQITTNANVNIGGVGPFRLNLTFEELEKY